MVIGSKPWTFIHSFCCLKLSEFHSSIINWSKMMMMHIQWWAERTHQDWILYQIIQFSEVAKLLHRPEAVFASGRKPASEKSSFLHPENWVVVSESVVVTSCQLSLQSERMKECHQESQTISHSFHSCLSSSVSDSLSQGEEFRTFAFDLNLNVFLPVCEAEVRSRRRPAKAKLKVPL